MFLATLAWGASDWEALQSTDGWTPLDAGEIVVEQRALGGLTCLRGTLTTPLDPDELFEVVRDIESEPVWSSETLVASELLADRGGVLEYYQHLAVPRWTFAADRYWVLRGHDASAHSTRELRWERFDWTSRYPDLKSRVDRDHPGAIEPSTNYGFWRFTPTASGTQATYAVCTDAGGAVPAWIQRRAARQALPNTMLAVMKEASRRSG